LFIFLFFSLFLPLFLCFRSKNGQSKRP
jgi:hypothetical protein